MIWSRKSGKPRTQGRPYAIRPYQVMHQVMHQVMVQVMHQVMVHPIIR